MNSSKSIETYRSHEFVVKTPCGQRHGHSYVTSKITFHIKDAICIYACNPFPL